MPPHRAPTETSAPHRAPSPASQAERALRGAAPVRGAALALLILSAGPALAAPPAAVPTTAASWRDGPAAAALADARDRADRAAAAVDDLKRELAPGHLTDPMPEADRTFGLASLRSDYADAQRRAAGYRATLGDQHPTLLAAEQVVAGLRVQLLDGTRKALASAERDAADAKAEAAAAERRLAAAETPRPTAADATGSIAAPPRPASPLSLPPAAPVPPRAVVPVEVAPAPVPTGPSLRTLAAALAAGALAALAAGLAALHLLRPRRTRAEVRAVRRVEPAVAALHVPAEATDDAGVQEPGAPPERFAPIEAAPIGAAPIEAVPVLSSLALPRRDGPATPDAAASAGLHETLRAAFGDPAGRMTVLVVPVCGLPGADADALALALALAAAGAGRNALLMEARAAGRLRGALVPAGEAPMLVEAGGAVRTLYRLGRAGAVAALLPSDPGEAEEAAEAGRRPGTARLRGLDGFDTVLLVGDDAAALAASADLVLVAAPAGTAPAALAAAALPLRAAGRPCGAVLVDRAAAPARPATLPRRPLSEPGPRLGLRGSIEPTRRRVVA